MYICHCDICDKRIEGINVRPHIWIFGEEEETFEKPPLTHRIDICDICFPLFREKVQIFLKEVRRK